MCKNFPTIGRKGIGTEGRKDREDPMAREPRASSKNLARWRPCRLPLPSAVGAISPASFEHEHDDEHEHLVADFGVSSVERSAALRSYV
jgi:hypothetical protein